MSHAELIAKFLINDLAGILKRKGFTFEDCPVPSDQLSYMLTLMEEGHLERKDVKLWCMETCDKALRLREIEKEVSSWIKQRLQNVELSSVATASIVSPNHSNGTQFG